MDNELLIHPERKYVVFESVMFFETVATPVVRKAWNQNGELFEVNPNRV